MAEPTSTAVRATTDPATGASLAHRRFFDPALLSAIGQLDLRARSIVEGFISGMHKSPFHGFSVEFAQHREYAPGDDIRHIDWKVYAKTDRFYIKQFEEETNLQCHLLVDISESMRYRRDRAPGQGLSKLDYAATAAAAIAHLLLRQKDSVGMALFDDHIRKSFPSSNKPSHIRDLFNELAQVQPREKTDIGPLLHQLAEELKKRRMVMIFSDLFTKPDEFFEALKHLAFNRHEIFVFHVMDEDELVFPFQRSTLFKGLEQMPQLLVDPRSLRQAYLDAVGRYLKKIERGCRDVGVEYLRLSTADPLDRVLVRFLAARGARTR